MDWFRYALLPVALVIGILLVVRPRLGVFGMILLFPFLYRLIPSFAKGINAETMLFFAALAGVSLHARPALPSLRALGPFAAWYACTAMGFVLFLAWPALEENPAWDLADWILRAKSYLWPSLVFFIGYALLATRESRERAISLLSPVVLVYALSGFIDYATGSLTQLGEEEYRAAGSLAPNPNILGAALAVLSLVPLREALDSSKSTRMRGFSALSYAIVVVALVLTQSRGSWLGYLAAHGVWLLLTSPRLFVVAAPTGMAALIGLYALGLMPMIISERIEKTLTPGTTVYQAGALAGRVESSTGSRLAYNAMAVEMIRDSPIWGHGFFSFGLLAPDYGAKYGVFAFYTKDLAGSHGLSVVGAPSTHNDYTRVAVDFGLIGTLGFAWMAFMLLSNALTLARKSREERTLGIIFAGMCVAFAVGGATQEMVSTHEAAIPFWLVAGIVARACYDHRRGLGAPAPVSSQAAAASTQARGRARKWRQRPNYAFRKT